jgi:hypothetical protein
MSDLVDKARAWDLLVARSAELKVRTEELERTLDYAEELERVLRGVLAVKCTCHTARRERGLVDPYCDYCTPSQVEARAVLEKGRQPSAAEPGGEEIENVAIVTRTVKAGQGRVKGEP